VANPKLRAFRSRVLYRALLLIGFLGRRLPLRLGQALGRVIGSLAYHVARRERRKALANIAVAFPDWSEPQRRDTIKAMFRHLGMSLFELVWLPNLRVESLGKTTLFEGLEPIAEIVRSGRAVIGFGAHCGNWEWMANAIAVTGMAVTALQRERSEAGLNEFILRIRAHAGVRTIDRGSPGAGRELIRSLRRGNLVGFLIDQSLRTESVKVSFFGKPALTPIGPARLAIRGEAVAVCVLAERRPDGTHHIRFSEPVQTRRDDDPVELTARMTGLIEEQIRRAPAQWVWMHDRWRDRPKWDVS